MGLEIGGGGVSRDYNEKKKQEATHRSCVLCGNRDKRPVRVNVFQELLPGFKQALNVQATGVVVMLQSCVYN